jgi:hypothetical protein
MWLVRWRSMATQLKPEPRPRLWRPKRVLITRSALEWNMVARSASASQRSGWR